MRNIRGGSHTAHITHIGILLIILLTACGNTTTTGNGSQAQQELKVALVTQTGGLNDNGFNQLAYKGYTKAKNEFGFQERVIQTQSDNDLVKNLLQASQVADLVIAIGFLSQVPIGQVAKQFPNKKFAIIDGCALPPNSETCETLPNVAPLFFSEQEAGCLVGAIAGQMEADGKEKIPKLSGNNTISALGGLSTPPVNRYIAGYKFCAQKVNPDVNVGVTYTQNFTNTAKCKDAALSQINLRKSDIIFQVAGGCGIGALDAADQKGVFGIGVDTDQSYIHPSVITSALKHVDVAVYDTIKQTHDGQFTNTPPRYDLKNDGVGYAPVSKDVPEDAKAAADKFAEEIKSGTLQVPEEIP